MCALDFRRAVGFGWSVGFGVWLGGGFRGVVGRWVSGCGWLVGNRKYIDNRVAGYILAQFKSSHLIRGVGPRIIYFISRPLF